ncbi:hypothetical protein [Paeniglutamicibacter sp. Y32M11]|uniref:hypothetical protein n=1 Tax=Paeniglutamicibacter sp. Y32M11 TaxID=2853258 RepID=UPI001C52A73B|nr:hypothetical protein [Paeniglutamicibacter sp. Y32M11]QXQ09965.1 hypothetical protein KUF55_16240 [Paeniglutamicibacter sp. Y32M11]
MALTISLARRYVAEHQVQGSISSRSVTVATGIGLGYPLTGIIAVIPSGPDERAPKTPFDSKGATLLGLGLGALLLGINEGPHWGCASLGTLGVLGLSAQVPRESKRAG